MDLIPIPFADPVSAFAPSAEAPWAILLDSAAFDAERGRYAYIPADPPHQKNLDYASWGRPVF